MSWIDVMANKRAAENGIHFASKYGEREVRLTSRNGAIKQRSGA
jgi:hypothetical protein